MALAVLEAVGRRALLGREAELLARDNVESALLARDDPRDDAESAVLARAAVGATL